MGFPRKVYRVSMVKLSADGGSGSVIYRGKKKRKKQSKSLRPLERFARRAAKAQRVSASKYLSRHASSNRDSRDGWAEDYARNVWRATRRGLKKLKF